LFQLTTGAQNFATPIFVAGVIVRSSGREACVVAMCMARSYFADAKADATEGASNAAFCIPSMRM
jgi:hypothetical protein